MISRPEQALHIAVAQYLDAVLPLENLFWTSIENNPRSRIAGALAKARGVRPGIPDVLIIWLGIPHWIELKAAAGSLSKVQRDVLPALERAGCRTTVCRSVSDVAGALDRWGIPQRGGIAA